MTIIIFLSSGNSGNNVAPKMAAYLLYKDTMYTCDPRSNYYWLCIILFKQSLINWSNVLKVIIGIVKLGLRIRGYIRIVLTNQIDFDCVWNVFPTPVLLPIPPEAYLRYCPMPTLHDEHRACSSLGEA